MKKLKLQKKHWQAAKLEFASPRGTFQPFTSLKFLPDSSGMCYIINERNKADEYA